MATPATGRPPPSTRVADGRRDRAPDAHAPRPFRPGWERPALPIPVCGTILGSAARGEAGDDTRECVELLRSQLLPKVNQFCYGQVRSLYGSGRFAHDLEEYLGKEEKLVVSEIADRDDIYDAIKDFLGKGR